MTSCAIVQYGTLGSDKDCKPLYFIFDALYPGSSILNLTQHPCNNDPYSLNITFYPSFRGLMHAWLPRLRNQSHTWNLGWKKSDACMINVKSPTPIQCKILYWHEPVHMSQYVCCNRTESDGFCCLSDIGSLSPVGVVAKTVFVCRKTFFYLFIASTTKSTGAARSLFRWILVRVQPLLPQKFGYSFKEDLKVFFGKLSTQSLKIS